MKIQIKIINSCELHDIRSIVLRNGLDPKMCTFEGDTRINSIHIGAFIENKIVGGVSLIKNNCKIIFPSTHVVYEGIEEVKTESGFDLTGKIKELVLLAQEQGYLTHDDVAEHLPKNKVTPADIDNVAAQFEQLEIAVVDQAEVDNVSPIRRGDDDKTKEEKTKLDILETQPRGSSRLLRMVDDYSPKNVSDKVLRIILSYTDFVNRKVWKKSD